MKQKKFFIFGQSRSGSTLLKELIDSHPDIHCDGELLEPDEGYVTNRLLLKVFKRIPLPLILYNQYRSKKAVYGFTLFVYHLRRLDFWIRWLVSSEWILIYIRRRNTLDQAFSNLVAQQTSFWHRRDKSGARNPGEIFIPVEKLMHALTVRERWTSIEQRIQSRHPHLEIVYDDMLKDPSKWPGTMSKVFSYLGKNYVPVHSKLQKTYPKPYSEIVSNYDELIQAVKASKFAYMLDNVTFRPSDNF